MDITSRSARFLRPDNSFNPATGSRYLVSHHPASAQFKPQVPALTITAAFLLSLIIVLSAISVVIAAVTGLALRAITEYRPSLSIKYPVRVTTGALLSAFLLYVVVRSFHGKTYDYPNSTVMGAFAYVSCLLWYKCIFKFERTPFVPTPISWWQAVYLAGIPLLLYCFAAMLLSVVLV
jgi:hypothetical protein